jgi:hypothetical protein
MGKQRSEFTRVDFGFTLSSLGVPDDKITRTYETEASLRNVLE